MNFRINLKPSPAAHYFTVQEHLRKINVADGSSDYLKAAEKDLKKLFNIPHEFGVELIELSNKEDYEKNFESIIVKDDLILGIDQLTRTSEVNQKTLLDLSFSFPQLLGKYGDYEGMIIDPNASLGIPADYFISFTKKHRVNENGIEDQISGLEKEAYLLFKVLNDLHSKGMELLVRESNYKAAVLYQLMESSKNMHAIASKGYRSKTIIVAECQADFLSRIEKLGYELSYRTNGEMMAFTIANYPTQSKELIEMFADRVDAL